jgi:hypothetical protein
MDYRLKSLYEQMLNGNSNSSVNGQPKNITEAYQTVVLNERTISQNAQLAFRLQAADRRLTAKSSGKEIRLQPIEAYTQEDLLKLFTDQNLTLLTIAKPGQEGARSGQLLTYIVQDENQNQHSIVLGKGKGFGVKDENLAIEDLTQQISSLVASGNGDHIILDINGNKQKIDGIKSTPGFPKSDFEFTYKGKSVLFISHKAGTTAKDYQQYGGTTCASGQNVCAHPEVVSFADKIKSMWPEMPPGKSVYRKIKDPLLKKYSLFGSDFGKPFGANNVDALYQGHMKLIPISAPNEYVIKAAHVTFNGDVPSGPYEPILYGRFSGSRGGNHGVKNLRTGILPLAKLSSSSEEI